MPSFRLRSSVLIASVYALVVSKKAEAQHDHGQRPAANASSAPSEPSPATSMPGAPKGDEADASPPVADVELTRNASGTAWQPETTPHAAIHGKVGGTELMFHTLLFGGYDYQATPRGANEPIAVGWLMGMARRRFESGSLSARVMLSPEPWTAGYRGGGYPLLLQTGETYQNTPLHDRQHPHDLFMEVAALYTQGLGHDLAVQLYAAPAGEPALGPVAFPHRYSASADPFATLSHHWQDSTHISFGVLTAGVITRWAKLEGSWFNGREPDEKRYDFDLRRPDSYSVRLSVAPAPSWSGQVSYGYLASPESLRPSTAVNRVTASATYDQALGPMGHWATTGVVGVNKESGESSTPAVLLETLVDLDGKNVVFGRGELVQKTGRDLVLTPALDEAHYVVGGLGAGYLRNVGELAGFLPGVGVRGMLDVVPAAVSPFYGGRVFGAGIVFVRVAVKPMPMMHLAHGQM